MKDYSVTYYQDQFVEIDFLTLAMVKKILRINSDDDDELLLNMIYAVCDRAEGILGFNIRRRLVTQRFHGEKKILKLKHLPVMELKHVSAITAKGIKKVFNTKHYKLSDDGKSIEMIIQNLSYHEVIVVYDCGYNARTIPAMIRQGLLCHLAALYDGSSDHYVMPLKVLDFYNSYKN